MHGRGNEPIWQQKMCNLVVLVNGDVMSNINSSVQPQQTINRFINHIYEDAGGTNVVRRDSAKFTK
ncbi:unnamed protein product [Sphenostylis stenocarpa]|uniref:Uncharacterized protein n=1 Tax=Sphenostylis stenocarpa TaxID=92480 RepID=A0AA86SRD8_9FABA|nr:unnamed protein product [Sphenostylis stenocarpa]